MWTAPRTRKPSSPAKLLNSGAVKAEDLLKYATTPPVAVAAPVKAGTLKKGMYGLSVFGSIISAIADLASMTADEASWEGDASPIPEQLRGWLTTGVQIFETMTTEETDELPAKSKKCGF